MKFVLYYVLFLNIVAIIPSFCEIENFEDDEEKLSDPDIESTKETVETLVFDKPIYKTPVPSGTFFFAETFDSLPDFKSKWITSKAHKDGAEESVAKYDGEWRLEEAIENPLKGDLGLVLKSRAKHHAISAKLDRPFHFTDKPFIVQYEVKFQNGLECGGAYIKLLTEDNNLDLEQFHDKTQYTIMFGPDKCGNSEKLHFIFQHKNPVTGIFEEKHAKKVDKKLENVFETKMTHLFTLAIHPDNTFDIYVDGDLTSSGSLLEDFTPAVNPPSEITDPDDKKPADWDDREKIPDPDAVKPEDWDEEEPEKILDPNAVKPAGWLDEEPELIPSEGAEKPNDWDDDVDGEWEPPLINNPKCEGAPGCGEWSPPQISNPNYKGRWDAPLINNPDFKGKYVGRMIPNPDYFEDKEPFHMTAISALGLELWSMTDDIYFDNFIVTNDKSVADQWADDGWKLKRAAELSRSGQGILSSLNLAIEERPWILVVITLTIGLGIILLIIYCVKPTMGEGLWSWFEYFLDLAAKYPAIWGLYAVVMLLPFVVASIFLCPNSGPLFKASDIDKHKKDDDSAVPEDTEADGFQVEEEEPLLTSEPSTGDKSPDKGKSKPQKEKKLPKSDGEGDNASSESAEGDIEDEGNEEGESAVRNRTKLSPQKRKTKARKD